MIIACLLASSCSRPQASATSTEPQPSVEAPVAEGAVAAPPTDDEPLLCEPVNFQCGCTWDCALLREHPDGVFVRLDSEGSQLFQRDDCSSGSCFQICAGEQCSPALVMVTSDPCTEACPPSRAPFGCRRAPGESTDPTGVPCQRDS